MNASERKPEKEILESLADAKKVFIAACIGCPVGCDVGGEAWIADITKVLEGAGKTVTGTCPIEMICNKALVGVKLGRFRDQVLGSDAVLVCSCGVGVQAAGNMAAVRVVPAMDTVCLGDYQGLWPGEERCAECGECVLAWTGGLCPITLCAKSLVNGQCGGTGDDGECEVSPEHKCGWKLIYDRLKELGRLDDMRRMSTPRDYRKRKVIDARRNTSLFAREKDQEAETIAARKPE